MEESGSEPGAAAVALGGGPRAAGGGPRAGGSGVAISDAADGGGGRAGADGEGELDGETPRRPVKRTRTLGGAGEPPLGERAGEVRAAPRCCVAGDDE